MPDQPERPRTFEEERAELLGQFCHTLAEDLAHNAFSIPELFDRLQTRLNEANYLYIDVICRVDGRMLFDQNPVAITQQYRLGCNTSVSYLTWIEQWRTGELVLVYIPEGNAEFC